MLFISNDHVRKYRIRTALLFVCLFLSGHLYATPTNKEIDTGFDAIDHQYRAFSSRFHKLFLQQKGWGLKKYQSIKPLQKAVDNHIKKDQQLLAANLIIKNIPMLKNNYDNLAIFNFIDILLEQNEWNAANLLFNWIKQEGDRTLVSNIEYIFAKHSFKRHEWAITLKHLKGSINDLPHEDYHHALLMQGISLQNLKKHRSSLLSYKKIPASSRYYVSARLNMAIANIRQGWWTDGHILIEDVLKTPGMQNQEESLNRLYLTLGYSFLNQEYHRNSREAFRNVGVASTYANNALLGIALTAANQEDYIGALNAVRILKEKNSFDLPVDESYLLMPYFYEKLQQHTTATSGYTEAINYYQRRIAGIKEILQSKINISRYPIKTGSTISVAIENNPVNFSTTYPDYFVENYIKLNRYPPYLVRFDNEKLNGEFEKLRAEFETTIAAMIRSTLNKRIEHLNSYMDQSRFGLARLYDSNLVSKQ